MNYTQNTNYTQLQLSVNDNFLMIPSFLDGFHNTYTTVETSYSQREVFCLHGILDSCEADSICPKCGKKMHINNRRKINLRHLCFGNILTCVDFDRIQYYCNDCHCSCMQPITFKADNHFITTELEQYTRDLLANGTYTLKQVDKITGLGKNTVKSIDSKRLKELYTIDSKILVKPERQAKYLGIDEFKLHNGHKYATHIIDMETGHILWIQHGKKKQVVYDFIKHVGLEWMDQVEAVACDMNSDFQEAFEEKCEHITIVYDYFHIVKNFNDKVVTKVRIDEQNRLKEEGNDEAAASLKKTNYILKSSRKTLQKKDKDAKEGKIISKESSLFNIPEYKRKEGYEKKYDELIKENELLFKVDLMKQLLTAKDMKRNMTN